MTMNTTFSLLRKLVFLWFQGDLRAHGNSFPNCIWERKITPTHRDGLLAMTVLEAVMTVFEFRGDSVFAFVQYTFVSKTASIKTYSFR